MILFLIQTVYAIEYLSLYGTSELPGFYYTEILIGSQESPRKLMIDIGSGLLTITCTGCNDCGKSPNPAYNYLESKSSKMISSGEVYDYSLLYSKESEVKGFFIEESVKFQSKDKKNFEFKTIIGCNIFESGIFTKPFVDGILGLSFELKWYNFATSIFENDVTLDEAYSVCIGEIDGFVAFGGFDEKGNDSEIVWQVVENNSRIVVDQVKIMDVIIGSREKFFISSSNTMSYFREQLFDEFLTNFQKFCKVQGNCLGKSTDVEDFSGLCFENHFYDYRTFPRIDLMVNASKIEFGPENYMIKVHSNAGIFCVGILKNSLKDENTLGTNFMRLKHIYFDIDQSKIGIAQSDCRYSYNISEIDYFFTEVENQNGLEFAENGLIIFMGLSFVYLIILVIFLLLKK
jgi:hypothetical protein